MDLIHSKGAAARVLPHGRPLRRKGGHRVGHSGFVVGSFLGCFLVYFVEHTWIHGFAS